MKRKRTNTWGIAISATLLLIVMLSLHATGARAFVVSALPGDNLLKNPWFNSSSNSSLCSLEGWTKVLNNGLGWGPSVKEQNPSPFGEVGTAARWAEVNGIVYPDVDVYLYQVVSSNSSNRSLKFSSWWVSHRIDILEYTVYGSSSAQGPWTKVWTPFAVSVAVEERPESGDKNDLWKNTGVKETTLAQGYPYYKLEIHARYPKPLTTVGSQGVGLKVTGVYFTALPDGSKPDNPLPTVEIPDGQNPTPTQVITKTRPAEVTPTPVITTTSTPEDSPTPVTTKTRLPKPTTTPKPTRTPHQ